MIPYILLEHWIYKIVNFNIVEVGNKMFKRLKGKTLNLTLNCKFTLLWS